MLNLQNTVAVNFAGTPALALPIPLHGAKVAVTSLQLIGPWLGEAQLLNAGPFGGGRGRNGLGRTSLDHEVRQASHSQSFAQFADTPASHAALPLQSGIVSPGTFLALSRAELELRSG